MRLVLIFFGLWFGLSQAQAAAPASNDVDALLRASGMQAQIDQIPGALHTAGQQQSGLGAGIVRPLVEALSTVFNPAEMQRMMRVEIIKQLDTPTLVEAMTWYNSPEAQSILAAEQRLFEPEVMDRIAAAMEAQSVPSLTPKRRELLLQVDQATNATDAALDMMMNMQAAFLTAFSHLLMPDQASEFNATLESFAGTRSQYKKLIQEQLLLQQAVLMEPVSDAALEHFRDFARTDAGHKTLQAMNGALNTTVRTMAQRIPEAMTQEEKSRQAPVPVPKSK